MRCICLYRSSIRNGLAILAIALGTRIAVGEQPHAIATPPRQMGLDDFVELAMSRHPKLAQAGFTVEAAQGRAIQAGLYPNPTITVTGDEIGDRTGPAGVWTAPFFTQEIVTRGKLRLARAAACREVDQASLGLISRRLDLLTAVRQSYFEVLALQRRVDILDDVVRNVESSAEQLRQLIEAKRAAPIDLIQVEAELERQRAERDAARRELPLAFRKLAATSGEPGLPVTKLVGALEATMPDYDADAALRTVQDSHPDVKFAQVGVERAQLLLRRAEVDRVPNVTLGAGYVRQNQNRSSDWGISVSMPIPAWNRNQGSIRAIQAMIGESVNEVGRVQLDLAERLMAALRDYAGARQRAERFRTGVLPKTRRAHELLRQSFPGQVDAFRVLQAQRAVSEANLEYNRALADAWKAAGMIAGLVQEPQWPLVLERPAR